MRWRRPRRRPSRYTAATPIAAAATSAPIAGGAASVARDSAVSPRSRSFCSTSASDTRPDDHRPRAATAGASRIDITEPPIALIDLRSYSQRTDSSVDRPWDDRRKSANAKPPNTTKPRTRRDHIRDPRQRAFEDRSGLGLQACGARRAAAGRCRCRARSQPPSRTAGSGWPPGSDRPSPGSRIDGEGRSARRIPLADRRTCRHPLPT